MTSPRIPIPHEAIADFCRRWKITEFALFGSVLRDDFGPESDVDVLVSFAPDSQATLLTLHDIEQELSELLGRPVDILTRQGVESSHNPYRKHDILSSVRVLYAA